MSLGFDLKLSMEQKLVMTMEMQLSVKLLQMSTYDLLTHINKELEENVTLEAKNNDDNESDIEFKKLIDFLKNNNTDSSSKEYKGNDEEVSPLNFVEAKKSLKDYLKEQVIDLEINKVEKKLCYYLIEDLNSSGYIEDDLSYIANKNNCDIRVVEKALSIIQSLEPIGIGARNLRECLKIQLIRKNIEDENIYIIIDKYLEEVSKAKYSYIAKELNLDLNKVQKYVDIIKTLEPKPSRGFFTGDETSYIIPDAIIKRIEDEFVIVMNDSVLPKLNINSTYSEIISTCEEKEVVDYVKEKVNKAMFLIKSIESRRQTLYSVISNILEIQNEYFLYGEDYLKPLTIKTVADNLKFHESTVSRAIKDKYIAIPSGRVVRIKDFFTNSLTGNDGEVSTYNIKRRIISIIENEDKKKPLSDSAICNILKNEGIEISRRTIAKYRDELNILSSAQRKRV
ncbi:RNA polymerase factor sigma-54 [Clostridium ihumii]|uniref:RNA polymerase factor sigma-54 n=1 Tax=Clostridium ihumii TaxID=1470356 RepID=UPI00055845B4|nr:RNA polymerase factor sigma-54 [Clostridium ihumii]